MNIGFNGELVPKNGTSPSSAGLLSYRNQTDPRYIGNLHRAWPDVGKFMKSIMESTLGAMEGIGNAIGQFAEADLGVDLSALQSDYQNNIAEGMTELNDRQLRGELNNPTDWKSAYDEMSNNAREKAWTKAFGDGENKGYFRNASANQKKVSQMMDLWSAQAYRSGLDSYQKMSTQYRNNQLDTQYQAAANQPIENATQRIDLLTSSDYRLNDVTRPVRRGELLSTAYVNNFGQQLTEAQNALLSQDRLSSLAESFSAANGLGNYTRTREGMLNAINAIDVDTAEKECLEYSLKGIPEGSSAYDLIQFRTKRAFDGLRKDKETAALAVATAVDNVWDASRAEDKNAVSTFYGAGGTSSPSLRWSVVNYAKSRNAGKKGGSGGAAAVRDAQESGLLPATEDSDTKRAADEKVAEPGEGNLDPSGVKKSKEGSAVYSSSVEDDYRASRELTAKGLLLMQDVYPAASETDLFAGCTTPDEYADRLVFLLRRAAVQQLQNKVVDIQALTDINNYAAERLDEARYRDVLETTHAVATGTAGKISDQERTLWANKIYDECYEAYKEAGGKLKKDDWTKSSQGMDVQLVVIRGLEDFAKAPDFKTWKEGFEGLKSVALQAATNESNEELIRGMYRQAFHGWLDTSAKVTDKRKTQTAGDVIEAAAAKSKAPEEAAAAKSASADSSKKKSSSGQGGIISRANAAAMKYNPFPNPKDVEADMKGLFASSRVNPYTGKPVNDVNFVTNTVIPAIPTGAAYVLHSLGKAGATGASLINDAVGQPLTNWWNSDGAWATSVLPRIQKNWHQTRLFRILNGERAKDYDSPENQLKLWRKGVDEKYARINEEKERKKKKEAQKEAQKEEAQEEAQRKEEKRIEEKKKREERLQAEERERQKRAEERKAKQKKMDVSASAQADDGARMPLMRSGNKTGAGRRRKHKDDKDDKDDKKD